MTSVSFVRKACETRKPRVSTRGRSSFSDKNSFRYTSEWLPTAHQIERSFFMSNDDKSLAYTRWNCKYHIIFTPKYRRKVIYEQLRKDLGKILRKLCEMKDVEIIEAHAMLDHIHMLVRVHQK